MLTLGVGALGPPIATLLVFAFNLAFLYRLIAIEEKFLRAAGGDAYAAYCRAVPRLLPRLIPPPLPADARRPNVARGFLTEIYMLGFALAMIFKANAVRLGHNYDIGWTFWLIVAACVVVQILFRQRGTDS
jgi:protein-S-isoprenylcysteine O-methyltransferase Ste14